MADSDIRLRLPELMLETRSVHGNRIRQIGVAGGEVDLTYLGDDGSAHLYQDGHGQQFVLLPPRVRTGELSDSACVLRSSVQIDDPRTFRNSDGRAFSWLQHPAQSFPTTPSEIRESWAGTFALNAPITDADTPGLRRAQLGAIHAISAHWTVSTDPATIVMPMGISKIGAHLKRRESSWRTGGHTRFRKGDWACLKQLEKFSRRARLAMSIDIVQPGLSRQRATNEILRLLGSVKEYVHQTARSPLRVVGSE